MPLILVVEQEKRYVERIQEALSPQGWEVVGVDDRAGVMRLVADRAADLVVVNAEVEEATKLLSSFSRATGGPGTVVLVPEAGDYDEVRQLADEVLEKPFTDQDIRMAVRRCVSAGRETAPEESQVAPPAPSGERLSSEELFGDVVLELEDAFSVGVGAGGTSEESGTPEAGEGPEIPGIEAEAEIDEALSGISAEEAEVAPEEEPEEEVAAEESEPIEEPEEEVEEEPAEEELAEEEPAEEELAEDGADEREPAAEELIEQEEGEEEPTAEEPADEEPVVEEPVEAETELVGEEIEVAAVEGVSEPEPVEGVELAPELDDAEPEEEEPEAEVGDEELPDEEEVAPAEEPQPKKPDLEDRLREAVLAGKAAAASTDVEPADEVDSAEAADLLLQKALGTLSWGTEAKPKLDEEFAEPAHATEEEVDELVGTVVGRPDDEASEEDLEDAALAEADDLEAPTSPDDEEPGLDVVEAELFDREEGEYRDRMKLVWAIIVIAILALLAFMVTRRSGEEAAPEQPVAVSPTAVESEAAGDGESPGAETSEEPGETGGEGTEDGGNVGDETEENDGGA